MLINTVEGQECRIAIVENGQLEELYVERVSSASHVGNIYKGRITNVEPSIQAAFVDFGLSKNGFLHISDVNPSYFPKNRRNGQQESVGRKKGHRDRPPIQDCLRRGQEVIVQLTKEGIGTKGPTMTTYISVPGRLLVMMPGMSRLGVSRKIDDDGARDKARAILAELNPPDDMGFIVRTAAIDRPKKEFQRDLNYLLRLWKNVRHRINTSKSPAEIYQESDLVTRTIRDVYNANIGRIICDNREIAAKAKEFLDVAMPRTAHNIELYTGKQGLFHDVGLEDEIEKIYARRIELPSGGSLVFDQAEALVAIDVNSGRFREHSDAETTATKMNMEAAREIARQLRLRDLGGVVIIDFIDMREEKNRRTIERVLRDEMKTDRAKSKVLRISAFGIIEMTRQRVRPSLKHSIFRTCGHCEGIGLIKSEESQSLLVMRNLQRACTNEQVAVIEVSVTPTVANHLSNFERRRILELEAQCNKKIVIKGDPALSGNQLQIACTNARGSQVAWEQPLRPAPDRTKIETVPLASVLPPALPAVEGEDFFDEEGDWMGGEPLEDSEAGEGGDEHDDEHAEAHGEEPVGSEARFASAEAAADSGEAAEADGGWLFQQRSHDKSAGGKAASQPATGQSPTGASKASTPAAPAAMSTPSSLPSVGQPAAMAAAAVQDQPAAPPTGDGEGQPGQPGEGKRRRRRGRRGGRRHRKHQEQLQAQQGAPTQPSQPVQPSRSAQQAPAAAPAETPSQPAPAKPQPQPKPQPPKAKPQPQSQPKALPQPKPQAQPKPQPQRKSTPQPVILPAPAGVPELAAAAFSSATPDESKPAAKPAAPAASYNKSARQEQASTTKPAAAGQHEPWMALFGGQDPAAKQAAPAATKPVVEKSTPAPAAPSVAAGKPGPVVSEPAAEPAKKKGRKPSGKTTAAKDVPAAKDVAVKETPTKKAAAKSAAKGDSQAVTTLPPAEPAAKRPRRVAKPKAHAAEPPAPATVPSAPTPPVPTPPQAGPATKPAAKRARRPAPPRQDPEYYEEHRREQKQARKRRPTDEIRDEDDVDFTRE